MRGVQWWGNYELVCDVVADSGSAVLWARDLLWVLRSVHGGPLMFGVGAWSGLWVPFVAGFLIAFVLFLTVWGWRCVIRAVEVAAWDS